MRKRIDKFLIAVKCLQAFYCYQKFTFSLYNGILEKYFFKEA